MGKTKKAKKAARAVECSVLPTVPFKVTLNVTAAEYESMLKEPVLFGISRLETPVVCQGVTYGWLMQPFKLIPNAKPELLGPQLFCRDEAEVETTRKVLAEKYQREAEDRQREAKERPIPATTLRKCFVVGRHTVTASGTLLTSVLSRPKPSTVSADLPPPDEPFLDVGNLYWRGPDGTGHAMKGVFSTSVHTSEVFRLVRYDEPVPHNGDTFVYGVEFAELTSTMEVLRVMERQLFATEAQALVLYRQKEIEAPKLQAKFLKLPVKSAEEVKEDGRIAEIQALADRAHDAEAKKRHLKRIEEIRAERREKNRLAAEATAKQAQERTAEIEAFNLLMDDNFPSVAKVRAELKSADLKPTPEYQEKVRRAMKIDCARLGIPSPVNQFAMDDQFAIDLAKALRAKSPLKPDQVTAVLNWVALDYQSMPESDWTARVAEKINAPVKSAGLGKTISTKFGLKSKLKGRPETGISPDNL